MQPKKNLHATVPPALLAELQQAAARERVTIDALLADAIGRHLERRELDDVLAFGKRHAAARGLTEGDIAAAIEAERQGHTERGH